MQTYCICVQSILVLPFAISGWFWIAFENLLGIFCCWNTFRSPVMDIKSYISTLSKIGQWTDRNRIELGIIGSINKPTPPYDVWLTLHFAGKAKGIGNHIFIFTIPFMSVVNKLWLETIMHMACSFPIKYILEEILPKKSWTWVCPKVWSRGYHLSPRKWTLLSNHSQKSRIEKCSDFPMSFL